jgi:hypothetical protein
VKEDWSDGTHDGVPSGILSSIELYLGIISACLPLIPPAFMRVRATVESSYIGGLLSRKRSMNSSLQNNQDQPSLEAKEPNYDNIELGIWNNSVDKERE